MGVSLFGLPLVLFSLFGILSTISHVQASIQTLETRDFEIILDGVLKIFHNAMAATYFNQFASNNTG
jgi:hypothetical protein